MTIAEKMEACKKFFDELVILLDNYTLVGSCNADLSAYLCPAGTESEISYSSKPGKSFRISDHWNWYANINKCPNPKYIQCWSIDLPYAKRRIVEGKASKPIIAAQVAVIGKDGKYHHVYGERFDRRTKRWIWDATKTPEEVIKEMEAA